MYDVGPTLQSIALCLEMPNLTPEQTQNLLHVALHICEIYINTCYVESTVFD